MFPCSILMVNSHHVTAIAREGHDDQDFQPLEMNTWVILPGRLPRPAEILAEWQGDLEWMEKEGMGNDE